MTHLVAVVASVLLGLGFTAVLPLGLGSVVLLGLLVAVGLVAGGVGEGPAVRLAFRASAPTDGDRQVLSSVPDLGQRWVLVCRSAASTAAPVVMMGRFTMVSAALVEAVESGQVSIRDVGALVVHARHALTRKVPHQVIFRSSADQCILGVAPQLTDPVAHHPTETPKPRPVWTRAQRLVETERRMVSVLDELELTELVTSITGLSAVGAAAILAETGDPVPGCRSRPQVSSTGSGT